MSVSMEQGDDFGLTGHAAWPFASAEALAAARFRQVFDRRISPPFHFPAKRSRLEAEMGALETRSFLLHLPAGEGGSGMWTKVLELQGPEKVNGRVRGGSMSPGQPVHQPQPVCAAQDRDAQLR